MGFFSWKCAECNESVSKQTEAAVLTIETECKSAPNEHISRSRARLAMACLRKVAVYRAKGWW